MKTLSDKPIVLLSKVAEVLFKHLFLVFMNINSLCDFFLGGSNDLEVLQDTKDISSILFQFTASSQFPPRTCRIFKTVADRFVDVVLTLQNMIAF